MAYQHWKGSVDSDGYQQSIPGYLLSILDSAMVMGGAIAFASLIGAFKVEDRYIATAVFAMIKGGLCILVAAGVLIAILKSRENFGSRAVVYVCVLAVVGLGIARHEHEQRQRAEAPRRPLVCKADSQRRMICGRPP